MQAQSNIRPEKFRIENLGETSDVVLIENLVEEEIEGLTRYTYDEYRINVVSRDNLQESVENYFEAWLQFCKDKS